MEVSLFRAQLTTLILLPLSLVACSGGKPCVGDYTVASPSELAVVTQCRSISGSLKIEKQAWLEDLDLSKLRSVDGMLVIVNNDKLAKIRIANLRNVGDGMGIYDNRCLSQEKLIAGLHSQLQVGGDAAVTANGAGVPCD
jgi:hypothetical protein